MPSQRLVHPGLGLFALGFLATSALAAPTDPLRVRRSPGSAEVIAAAAPLAPVAGVEYQLTLEGSGDLAGWSPSVALVPTTDPTVPLHAIVPGGSSRFFRLRTDAIENGRGSDAAEFLGYNRVFARELGLAGYPSTAEFIARSGPAPAYLPSIDFDPTTAKFWDLFALDPVAYNATLPANSPDRRMYDFRLNAGEMARFKTNGFVVSERLGSHSFADVYYKIFTDDLPVFVSADSALHAWHWSYQAMLGELEETYLSQALNAVLVGTEGQVPGIAAEVGNGALKDSALDADYYLTVGSSLFKGTQVASGLGQDARVAATLSAINAAQFVPGFNLWGSPRDFDFSQFTVRGHYTRTDALGRYFKAFMWTALADLRVAGKGSSPRELGTAIVLDEAARRASQATRWQQIDDTLRLFVGRPMGMTIREMGPMRSSLGWTLASMGAPGNLGAAQASLSSGPAGVQAYANATYASPNSKAQIQLPRVFAFTGQRFISDGWCTAKVTFDNILWPEDLPDGKSFHGKVVRRLPSGLDVAYGVFGNRQLAPDIADGIEASGLPYQHNLLALASAFDQEDPATWNESTYARWLFALRQLSSPTTDPAYPQAMRTRAWMHRTTETQLASWTQLRHDTVLYAAQPYTGIILCEYPAGYIEPRVEFWEAMRAMATATADGLAAETVSGTLQIPQPGGGTITVNLATQRAARVAHCRNFASQMATLKGLAAKELAAQPFDAAETLFVRSTMNAQDHDYFGKTFDGWYPKLFYKDYGQVGGNHDINASDRRDWLVTDVHSAPPDFQYQGGVLHEGIGDVDLMLIAVDSGTDRMVYAGPVMSHYEVVVGPGLKRYSDGDWFGILSGPNRPARPAWTRDYLVPR